MMYTGNNDKKRKRVYKVLLALLLLMGAMQGRAQCAFRNDAFKSGEFLTYNLYYNWKFVWVKAGTASMSVVQSIYGGRPAYRGSLITRGNSKVDHFFVLRDTLLCYSSVDMAPLYYRKGAREGSRYTVDEVFYSYPEGKCQVRQHRQRNDGSHFWDKRTLDDCVYDMMNIFLRARSFNPEGWKNGHDIFFTVADGDGLTPAILRYNGKVNIKADNDRKYRCLELAYIERKDGKTHEIARFYVTDDANHVPVRIDMNLKFGSAKAFLVGMKGLRNPVNSLVN